MINIPTFSKFIYGYNTRLIITSDFGKRKDPFGSGAIKNHNGIDIDIPSGTLLCFPWTATVFSIGVQANGAGLHIILKRNINGIDFYILFHHLSRIFNGIQVGRTYTAGQPLAYSGGATNDKPNCGASTGPHLHLEIRKGGNSSGNAVDPKFFFLVNYELRYAKSGKLVCATFPDMKYFSDADLRSQSKSKYNPATQKEIKTNATEAKKKRKPRVTYTTTEKLAPGIWQIIKVLIDSSVEGRQLSTYAISTLQGSLINFFKNVCQEPMVEFMGDTYGNQYYWIIRKPPFDKESIMRHIKQSWVGVISHANVISTQLEWNTQNIYSWYRYIPTAEMMNIKQTELFIPAVFFPEFAALYGSKPLCIESNYWNKVLSGSHDESQSAPGSNGERNIQNAVNDLKYLIESNAYNAFTRRGTITIKGDRRFKRGTWIYFSPTQEYFYVDSVQNSFEVSSGGTHRITTLQVSRGMVYSYIEGVHDNKINKTYSYFNIIDFGGFDPNKVTKKNWLEVVSKFKVDRDNFGFFMAKNQSVDFFNFDNKDEPINLQWSGNDSEPGKSQVNVKLG